MKKPPVFRPAASPCSRPRGRNGLEDTRQFFTFFESFKKNQYLHSYSEAKNIAYALKRICMRIWDNPFTSEQEEEITRIVDSYIFNLREDFILIFDEIESQLDNE
ncbi:MAG: hypothetical protein EOO38_30985 [Cytophagaceae bacterium]|nr:MAG: hypothetical protein EOO38_30985 [Cytophagaceae bacterium]